MIDRGFFRKNRATLIALAAMTALAGPFVYIFHNIGLHNEKVIEAYSAALTAQLKAESDFDAEFIEQRAKEVGEQVREYLVQTYGSLENVPAPHKLQGDEAFKKVAVQWLVPPAEGEKITLSEADEERRGYTVVYADDFTMTTHVQPWMVGRRFENRGIFDKQYVLWWQIFGKATKETKRGFYLWNAQEDGDGDPKLKYMVCTPIAGTRLIVAATEYPTFQRTEGALDKAQATVTVISDLFKEGQFAKIVFLPLGLVLIVVATTGIAMAIQREAARADRDKERSETYLSMVRADTVLRELSHGIKGDTFIIRESARQSIRGLEGVEGAEPVLSKLREIVLRGERIDGTVIGLIDDQTRQFKRIDLVELVRECVVNRGDRTRTLKISITGHEGEAAVEGIPEDLTKLLTNVILNSAQATEGGGTMNIRIEPHPKLGRPGVLMTFRDSGRGFERPAMATTAGWTTKANKQGTGQGLTIVQRIVLQHDGDLEVRNRTDGKRGAEVAVWLPAAGHARLGSPTDPDPSAG